ncbi:MAG: CoA-binding protein [Bacteroidales bacterium]|nr:CoA-binding protein [Bacteroidales bacterium]
MKVTKKDIDNFFEPGKIAVAGVSRNTKKFGYSIFHELSQKGIEVVPVNPKATEIDGVKCYAKVNDLPVDVKSLLIVTPKEETDAILREAIDKGIQNIWVQQMSETEESIKIAEEYQKEVIFKKCIFMFAEPVQSIHKFHRMLTKIFGGLPK